MKKLVVLAILASSLGLGRLPFCNKILTFKIQWITPKSRITNSWIILQNHLVRCYWYVDMAHLSPSDLHLKFQMEKKSKKAL